MKNVLRLGVLALAAVAAAEAAPVYVGFFEYHSLAASTLSQFHLGVRTHGPAPFNSTTYIVESPITITQASLTLNTDQGQKTVAFACSIANPCVANTAGSYLSEFVSNAWGVMDAVLNYTVSGPPTWDLVGSGVFVPTTNQYQAFMNPAGQYLIPDESGTVGLLVGEVPEPSTWVLMAAGLGALVARRRARPV